MKRGAMILLAVLVLIVSGCSVSQTKVEEKEIATPIQVQTFAFETGQIEKSYAEADKKLQEALDKLLAGKYNKFQANAVFITTRKVISKCIDDIHQVNAPGQLLTVRDDLNFSLVYYQEALETLNQYLNTEDSSVLEEARQQMAKAEQLLDDYRFKMKNFSVEDINRTYY